MGPLLNRELVLLLTVRHSKMTREMKNTIRDIDLVERHPDFTIRMINEELRRQLQQAPQVGRSTISSTLEGLMITLKKTSRRAS